MSTQDTSGQSEKPSASLPIIMRRDFPPRTICAPKLLASDLRERLQSTYGEFFIRTIEEDEVQVSTDIYDLARPLFKPSKPR